MGRLTFLPSPSPSICFVQFSPHSRSPSTVPSPTGKSSRRHDTSSKRHDTSCSARVCPSWLRSTGCPLPSGSAPVWPQSTLISLVDVSARARCSGTDQLPLLSISLTGMDTPLNLSLSLSLSLSRLLSIYGARMQQDRWGSDGSSKEMTMCKGKEVVLHHGPQRDSGLWRWSSSVLGSMAGSSMG
jgi:hypothetical protein